MLTFRVSCIFIFCPEYAWWHFFIKGVHMYVSLLLDIFSVNLEIPFCVWVITQHTYFIYESSSCSSCKILVMWDFRKKRIEVYFGSYFSFTMSSMMHWSIICFHYSIQSKFKQQGLFAPLNVYTYSMQQIFAYQNTFVLMCRNNMKYWEKLWSECVI